jgi:hypothetical protein
LKFDIEKGRPSSSCGGLFYLENGSADSLLPLVIIGKTIGSGDFNLRFC